jgi:hypothetical protein
MATALSLTSLSSIPQDVIRIISRLSFIHHDVLDLKSHSINPFVRFFRWWASWGLPGESNAGRQVQQVLILLPKSDIACTTQQPQHSAARADAAHGVVLSMVHCFAGMGMFSEAYILFSIG